MNRPNTPSVRCETGNTGRHKAPDAQIAAFMVLCIYISNMLRKRIVGNATHQNCVVRHRENIG